MSREQETKTLHAEECFKELPELPQIYSSQELSETNLDPLTDDNFEDLEALALKELAVSQKLSEEDQSLSDWIRQNDEELALEELSFVTNRQKDEASDALLKRCEEENFKTYSLFHPDQSTDSIRVKYEAEETAFKTQYQTEMAPLIRSYERTKLSIERHHQEALEKLEQDLAYEQSLVDKYTNTLQQKTQEAFKETQRKLEEANTQFERDKQLLQQHQEYVQLKDQLVAYLACVAYATILFPPVVGAALTKSYDDAQLEKTPPPSPIHSIYPSPKRMPRAWPRHEIPALPEVVA